MCGFLLRLHEGGAFSPWHCNSSGGRHHKSARQRPIKPSQFYLTDGTKPIAVLTAWPTSINFWLAGLLAVWPSDL
jgi:hypothetical protein